MNQVPFKLILPAARVNAGYSQKDVADILHVNVNTVVSWEKDSTNISHKWIEKLSKLYKIPTNNIFFGNRYEFISMMQKT